jgi:hypothetical protein
LVRLPGAARTSEDLRARWQAGRPILLRGVLRLAGVSDDVRRTRRLFEHARAGLDVEGELRRRLARAPRFALAGVSVDLGDPREVLKLHADESGELTSPPARDLWAKLSWVSRDASDASLRVRCSFGSERLLDWRRDARRARAADRLAEALFPECRAVTRDTALALALARLAGRRVRLSERIVYSNAPGGGAAFHHDAEPCQLGVLYAQLAGATGWLALPQGELADALASVARGSRVLGTPARARRALEREPTPALERLLNADPRLTRALVERGAFHRLRHGDVLLLPSPRPDAAAWHSVFALGRAPSLAHSYGIFATRD